MRVPAPTQVTGATKIKEEYRIQEKTFLKFFKVESRELISTTSGGNEIYITTPHQIDAVYINGKKI